MLLLGVREAGRGDVRMQSSAGPWYTEEVPVTLVSGILAHWSFPQEWHEGAAGDERGQRRGGVW